MRLLFEIDKKNYDPNGKIGTRPSVRGVIIRDGKVALVHSLKYDYYKFPGGGINAGEKHDQTLIREVREETGLCVIPETIREYGYVHRIEKGKIEDIFVQDNYYYFCGVSDGTQPTELDGYEADEMFTLEFVKPEYAIEVNLTHDHGSKEKNEHFAGMNERETKVLQMIAEEFEA